MTKIMIKGVLKTWKEDRGFGFISPDNGGKDIFMHISALKEASRRPVAGDVIYYQVAKDNRGKFKAVNASIEGVEILEDKIASFFNSPKNILLTALGLALIIVVSSIVYLYSV